MNSHSVPDATPQSLVAKASWGASASHCYVTGTSLKEEYIDKLRSNGFVWTQKLIAECLTCNWNNGAARWHASSPSASIYMHKDLESKSSFTRIVTQEIS
jgi:hypothetical protein